MFLVVCLPSIAAFIALWKCINKDDAKEWAVGFFAYFASVFALSMGLMLGTQQNRFEPYGLQAALMIFAVCPDSPVLCLALCALVIEVIQQYLSAVSFPVETGICAKFRLYFCPRLDPQYRTTHSTPRCLISIPASELKAGKTAVLATLGFTPSIFGGIQPGGTITLTYPSGFFAPSVTPVVPVGGSNVAGLTATCGATIATSVVITTPGLRYLRLQTSSSP
jgi:hypothetical protein